MLIGCAQPMFSLRFYVFSFNHSWMPLWLVTSFLTANTRDNTQTHTCAHAATNATHPQLTTHQNSRRAMARTPVTTIEAASKCAQCNHQTHTEEFVHCAYELGEIVLFRCGCNGKEKRWFFCATCTKRFKLPSNNTLLQHATRNTHQAKHRDRHRQTGNLPPSDAPVAPPDHAPPVERAPPVPPIAPVPLNLNFLEDEDMSDPALDCESVMMETEKFCERMDRDLAAMKDDQATKSKTNAQDASGWNKQAVSKCPVLKMQ